MFRTRNHRWALAALGLVIAGLTGPARAFNTDKVMNVIKFPPANHRVVISHRGIVGVGCPENSSCSIQQVFRSGVVEAIELDVKSDSQRSLWLMHDQNMGRMTNPTFNIFTGQGANSDIRALPTRVVLNAKLLDRRRDKLTGYYMLPLGAALRSTGGIVSILDLKTHADAIEARNQVRVLGYQRRVILKVSAGWHANSPQSVTQGITGVPYAITLYLGDVDRILGNWPSSLQNQQKVAAWVDAAIKANSNDFMFLEIGNKQQIDADPMYWFVKGYAKSPVATSQFIPVPEYPVSPEPPVDNPKWRQNGYVRSNSTCCAALSDYLGNSRFLGRETFDARPKISEVAWQWQAFDSLLTDEVQRLHGTMNRAGFRKLNLYN